MATNEKGERHWALYARYDRLSQKDFSQKDFNCISKAIHHNALMAGGGKHTWRSSSEPQKPMGVGRPESGGDDPCDIQFETTLNSVDQTAIQKVCRGTTLTVAVAEENNIARLQATLEGVRVGVIAHPKTLEIIACIRAGNQYVAAVMDRQGNLCRVRVERQAP